MRSFSLSLKKSPKVNVLDNIQICPPFSPFVVGDETPTINLITDFSDLDDDEIMSTPQINEALKLDQPPPLRRLDEARGLGGCRKAIDKNQPPIEDDDTQLPQPLEESEVPLENNVSEVPLENDTTPSFEELMVLMTAMVKENSAKRARREEDCIEITQQIKRWQSEGDALEAEYERKLALWRLNGMGLSERKKNAASDIEQLDANNLKYNEVIRVLQRENI